MALMCVYGKFKFFFFFCEVNFYCMGTLGVGNFFSIYLDEKNIIIDYTDVNSMVNYRIVGNSIWLQLRLWLTTVWLVTAVIYSCYGYSCI